jgi:hypothetical protein
MEDLVSLRSWNGGLIVGSMGLIALMIDKLGGTYWSLVGEFLLYSFSNPKLSTGKGRLAGGVF